MLGLAPDTRVDTWTVGGTIWENLLGRHLLQGTAAKNHRPRLRSRWPKMGRSMKNLENMMSSG